MNEQEKQNDNKELGWKSKKVYIIFSFLKKLFHNQIFIFILFSVIIISGVFYWFAYRPAKIRHDCSWFKVITPAAPAKPAITKDEAVTSQLKYNECINNQIKTDNPFLDALNNKYHCDGLLKQETPAIPAKPETYWYREAKKAEYDFCIREKGLRH